MRARLPGSADLPEALWRRHDRLLRVLLWLHVPLVAALALAGDGVVPHGPAEAAALAVIAALAGAARDRAWRSCLTTAGLLSCSAALVHVTGGLIEMYFHFFVVLALVALYQDWRPYLLALLYVVLHHGLLGVLSPASAALHGAFLLAAGGAQLLLLRTCDQARGALREAQRSASDARGSARLARATAALAVARTPAEVARAMRTEGLAVAGADAGGVVLRGDGSAPPLAADEEDGERSRRWAELSAALAEPVAEVLDGGPPVLCHDRAALEDRFPGLVARPCARTVRALAVLPLVASGRVIGVLVAAFPAACDLTRTEPALLTLAHETARAVERVRLAQIEHEMSVTLQRSLLPERLPELPGVEVAVRYLPGTAGQQVGGDWYDCTQLPDGRVALALGDVVGKGVRAAALMGQLRNAVRAYALQGLNPSSVLSWTERLRLLGDEELATLVLGVLDVDAHTLRFANAGHLPPLILTEGGTASLQECDGGLPLGVAAGQGSTPERTVRLELGATVLLFSDGLVEDRSRSLPEGLAQLTSAASAAALRHRDDLDALCDDLLGAMLDAGPDTDETPTRDDISLLAVRLLPVGPPPARRASLVLPAEPHSVDRARRFVRATLTRWGRGALAEDTELCTSELVGDAIARGDGEVLVDLSVRSERVRLAVEQTSHGEPTAALIDVLAESWGVEPTPAGRRVWCELRTTRSQATGRLDDDDDDDDRSADLETSGRFDAEIGVRELG